MFNQRKVKRFGRRGKEQSWNNVLTGRQDNLENLRTFGEHGNHKNTKPDWVIQNFDGLRPISFSHL